jgi:hypothetical protein
MLLKVRFVADSIPSALTNPFAFSGGSQEMPFSLSSTCYLVVAYFGFALLLSL